ncbi:Trk system potassium transporter TrkA [Candidatus Nitrosacidococcus tergens]|uniref:Trk system potassium uptake protein TrkA n=1 Tax=Candidatus Nitrosacidococcus tergens TaxID=553981 RepID=A0A7G1QBW5_9GAMM|nr:Trk system potassium transporter TrkA [Candidatus Nitrosacidococcus tergens]CAB1277301.1 NAD-binding component of TrK potassium transporter [Candidatus Nitrosacidococcus tergens]
MKIIILGAGQVGRSVATNLAGESNDITLVDVDGKQLKDIGDRLDIRTIEGSGAHPNVLARAGAEEADMLIAVTRSDEVNIVACQVAYSLFNTPTKVARIRSSAYISHPQLFSDKLFPIDMLISPEELVTNSIKRLIENPGSLQVLDFAEGKVQLVAVKAYHDGLLVGHQLRELPQRIPGVKTRVAAIFRKNKPIFPQGDTVIEVDDEVFFTAPQEDISKMMRQLRSLDKPYKRIMLGGGGSVGHRLARVLEKSYQVKVIEANPSRAKYLSESLNKSLILVGDIINEELLVDEGIEDIDVFCALTNDDAVNILAAMLAKRLGAKKVMSLINRGVYADLVESGTVDIAISPHQATIGILLARIRRGDVVAAHSLRHGAVEAFEAVAHGDKSSSKVVGRGIEEIKLPSGTTIGAVVRGDEVLIAHHNTVIKSGDHVILFLTDKRRISEVERLFQVGFGFL